MSDDVFARIPSFPNYRVCRSGRVINVNKQVDMTHSPNQRGELTVGLSRHGQQMRRSVKVLVAKAFVPGESPIMNTVVQLDGDINNVDASNLVWRPRWWAWKYNEQWKTEAPSWAWAGPIINNDTGKVYENMVDASMSCGFLIEDIRVSIRYHVPVFPTAHTFSFV